LAPVLLVCASCASDAIAPGDPTVLTNELQAYHLGPGDQLRIVVYGETSLSGQFAVNAGGAVSFPLVGEVPAQGKTTVEFAAALEAALRQGYVRDPNVTVDVTQYRPYFILGEIGSPGTYAFSAGLSVLNAVATAGGFSYRADVHRVYIKHAEEAGEHEYPLTGTTPIQPGDTVRIPERRF
jgi:polysaccharide export outer membrane protein